MSSVTRNDDAGVLVLSALVPQLGSPVSPSVFPGVISGTAGFGVCLCPGNRMSLWGKLASPGDILTLTPLALLLDRQPCLRDVGAPRCPPQPRRFVSTASIGSARAISERTWVVSFLSSVFRLLLSPVLFHVNGILASP